MAVQRGVLALQHLHVAGAGGRVGEFGLADGGEGLVELDVVCNELLPAAATATAAALRPCRKTLVKSCSTGMGTCHSSVRPGWPHKPLDDKGVAARAYSVLLTQADVRLCVALLDAGALVRPVHDEARG